MTHVKAGQRRRAKAPKVRTGCRTCKARRVKCDEGQPTCKRCISTGRECEGYEPLPLIKPIRFVTMMHIAHPTDELRSFQYFQENTMTQLFTFIQEDIWTSHIIQTANLDQGIWHSVVAFSSFHELFMRHGRTGQENQERFALKQYNMSIQSILGSKRNSSNAHIHLISCILFICIEVLRGRTLTVLQLLSTGYGILSEERLHSCRALTDSNGPSSHDRHTLFASADVFLSRIASQAYLLAKGIDDNLASLVAEILDFEQFAWGERPRFHSLNQAHHALGTLRLELETFHQCGVGMVPIKLQWWASAFEDFKKDYADRLISDESRRAVALLELQRRYVYVETIVLDGPPGLEEDPLRWDAHTDAFREMMHYAEVATDLDSQKDAANTTKPPLFHMHIGVVPVLYGIIHKCREPAIRRRAISLMASSQRQEGVWNSQAALTVALKAKAFEEQGVVLESAANIPAAARVRRITVLPVWDSQHSQTHAKSYMVGYEVGNNWAWEDAATLVSTSPP